MSVTPRGMSVQEAYRLYRDGKFLVTRPYQRKLVWTLEEKQKLIDSILRDYPIPLVLLAERPTEYGIGTDEIIDGMQRFNAIFTFIENALAVNGQYFNIQEFARAKLAAEAGRCEPAPAGASRLPSQTCANLLDYQLAVTIFPAAVEGEITEMFGRINSGGKLLSPQEKRQTSAVSPCAEMVRTIASELRGDASKEVLLLTEMLEISSDSKTARHGYGLRAEDTSWVKQGVLRVAQLQDSEDEQMIADIAASILLH